MQGILAREGHETSHWVAGHEHRSDSLRSGSDFRTHFVRISPVSLLGHGRTIPIFSLWRRGKWFVEEFEEIVDTRPKVPLSN